MSQESLESGKKYSEQLGEVSKIKRWRVSGEKRHDLCVDVRVPDGDSAQDQCDFSWDDYLEETGTVSVPHHAFKHVGADDHSRSQHTSLNGLL